MILFLGVNILSVQNLKLLFYFAFYARKNFIYKIRKKQRKAKTHNNFKKKKVSREIN